MGCLRSQLLSCAGLSAYSARGWKLPSDRRRAGLRIRHGRLGRAVICGQERESTLYCLIDGCYMRAGSLVKAELEVIDQAARQ